MGEIEKLKEEIKRLKNRESAYALLAERLDAICHILNGEEPSEFMLSFPEVRDVLNLMKN